ncbi:MAG TPA: bifunctional 4-hydroxy-2-oxoglutarate aldolase/2-dehydro-3-deoxy-phosphogluconate aldolase [Terriglobales bacterium]|nr:bifunctional 4-hydroxy-2-oxoglutarate aldolase/2-dehydro-3-deoxy-phosphogluconate aldolase [Terriglobales bacterium]
MTPSAQQPGRTPATVIARLRSAGVIPVVEIDDPGRAVALAQALEGGGLPIVEVTFRTEAAADSLRRIARDTPRMFLIAGTVTSTHQADVALDAGVDMLVAPGLNRDVVEHALRIGLPMMPGVCTPTEVEAAMSLGLTALKLFPIEPIGGLRYLRALAAPYPSMTWNPTGGITTETLPGYLAVESVLSCGGSWVAPRADIAAGRFEEIAARAAAAVEIVRRIRASQGDAQ